MECRRVDERLEGGARLAVGHERAIELTGPVVAAADQRSDLAGARIDRNQRRLEAGGSLRLPGSRRRRLEAVEPSRDRLFRESLEDQIEARGDAHVRTAVPIRVVEALLELLSHGVDEVRRRQA